MSLNIIDVSSYQSGLDVGDLTCDGVIVKVTQGTWYTNPAFSQQVSSTLEHHKLLGLYHFIDSRNDIKEQVKYFLSRVSRYIGKAVFFLDFENYSENGKVVSDVINQNGVAKALEFLQFFESQTGIKPIIYMSLSVENNLDWSRVVNNNNGLWVAQYNTMAIQYGYANPTLYGSLKHWKNCALHQYSSNARIGFYNKPLDVSIFYGNQQQWQAYQTIKSDQPTKPVNTPPAINTQAINSVARDMIRGIYGNGVSQRKTILYRTVQGRVNKIMQGYKLDHNNVNGLAYDVINGFYGNGNNRIDNLYNAVQKEVNKLI